MKLLAVTPLVCAVPPADTDAPVVVKVATSPFRFVPKGTVTEIFVPVITPVADRLAKLKAVIAFAGLGATVTVTV